jgi:hypothetical protein
MGVSLDMDLSGPVFGTLPVTNGGTGTSTAFTAGSVVFAGPSGVYAQDNTNLFYDDATNRLRVNQLDINSTTPLLYITDSDAASNAKIWRQQNVSGTWSLLTRTDVDGTGANLLTCTRSGASITLLTLSNTDLAINTAGKGLQIKEGSNARMGTATLSGGTIVVSNNSVASTDRIFITRVSGTSGNFGHLSYTISAATSFTINSTNASDDSLVNWMIVTPAA